MLVIYCMIEAADSIIPNPSVSIFWFLLVLASWNPLLTTNSWEGESVKGWE